MAFNGYQDNERNACVPCPPNTEPVKTWNDSSFSGYKHTCHKCPSGFVNLGNGRPCEPEEKDKLYFEVNRYSGKNELPTPIDVRIGETFKRNKISKSFTASLDELPCGKHEIVCKTKDPEQVLFVHEGLEYRCGDNILISHPFDKTCASRQDVISVHSMNEKVEVEEEWDPHAYDMDLMYMDLGMGMY